MELEIKLFNDLKCYAPGSEKVKNGFILNDMRHTFVTDMRKAGVSKSVRMSITGHSPKDMDDRYNEVDDQDKLEAIKRLEAYRFQNVDQKAL